MLHHNIPPGLYIESVQVGSSVTCNPPIVDSDIDFLILCHLHGMDTIEEYMLGDRYRECSIKHPHFKSFRRGRLNVTVTCQPIFFHKSLLAHKLAKRFNLLDKRDRIALFHAIIHGEDVDAWPGF